MYADAQYQLTSKALRMYQYLKLPVFPCRDKVPLVKDWPKRHSPTSEEINSWLDKYNVMNIGLTLGLASNMVGIDVDGQGGKKILEELSQGDLPTTWKFSTQNGGIRYLYRIPPNSEKLIKFTRTDKSEHHNECALLGEGQMTIMPPSIGKNGQYKWINHPMETEIAYAPDWMIKLMSKTSKQKKLTNKEKQAVIILGTKCRAFKKDWKIQIEEGLDNDSWFLWSSLLTNAGFPESAKLFSKISIKHNANSDRRLELLKENNIKGLVSCLTFGCPEQQIRQCFSNNIRFNEEGIIKNSPGYFLIQKNTKENIQMTQAQLEAMGFEFSKDGQFKRINGNIYSRHLLRLLDIVYVSSGQRYCIYDNGIWVYQDKNNLSRKLRDILHQYMPDIWTSNLEDVYIQALSVEAPRVEKLDSNKNLINLENGMLNLNHFKLIPHDKKYFSSIRVPIIYNPDAKCPQFIRFLNDVFEGDQERIDLISEVLGYCLTAETKAHKAILLYGRGSNGKSVLAEILACLCGRENVSSVPLQDLENSFARFELVDKLVNLATENEVDKNGLTTTHFKSIVTGDPIRVERKYEPGFTYQPICKLVFALNNLPYSRDKSYGFERRLLIIPFNRSFSKDEKDPNLTDKLKTELSGILNFALKGLQRLRNNKYEFSTSKVVNEAVAEYTENLNPIKSFVDERFVLTNNPLDKVSHNSLRVAYETWCTENGFSGNQTSNSRAFIKNIKDTLKDNNISFGVSKAGNNRYITGVKLVINLTDNLEESLSIDDM